MAKLVSVGKTPTSPHLISKRTSRLPVYYVFGNNPIDTDDFLTQLQHQLKDKRIILFYDTPYEYAVNSIRDRLPSNVIVTSLKDKFQSPLNKETTTPSNCCNNNQENSSCCNNNNNNNCCVNVNNNAEEVKIDYNTEFCGRQYKLNSEHPTVSDYSILFIGDENSRTLNNLIMNFTSCEV